MSEQPKARRRAPAFQFYADDFIADAHEGSFAESVADPDLQQDLLAEVRRATPGDLEALLVAADFRMRRIIRAPHQAVRAKAANQLLDERPRTAAVLARSENIVDGELDVDVGVFCEREQIVEHRIRRRADLQPPDMFDRDLDVGIAIDRAPQLRQRIGPFADGERHLQFLDALPHRKGRRLAAVVHAIERAAEHLARAEVRDAGPAQQGHQQRYRV